MQTYCKLIENQTAYALSGWLLEPSNQGVYWLPNYSNYGPLISIRSHWNIFRSKPRRMCTHIQSANKKIECRQQRHTNRKPTANHTQKRKLHKTINADKRARANDNTDTSNQTDTRTAQKETQQTNRQTHRHRDNLINIFYETTVSIQYKTAVDLELVILYQMCWSDICA